MFKCKISENLVQLRLAKGVTQNEVARNLSVSDKTVSKWENGSSMPDLPMLAELSKYYGVTTDTLLGLSEGEELDTEKAVRSAFIGLERKKAVLKAFEIERAIIPAIFDTVAGVDDVNNNENVFPSDTSRFYRSQISIHNFFQFTTSSEDVNLAVTLLRNKKNFSWLKNPEKQKRIVNFFHFLSDEDALSVLYFIHSSECAENFTVDYVSENTGVPEERVSTILKQFCDVGECSSLPAHLAEGDVDIYKCFGDGIILSVISLAYDKMCGAPIYSYNFTGKCKMIGGE